MSKSNKEIGFLINEINVVVTVGNQVHTVTVSSALGKKLIALLGAPSIDPTAVEKLIDRASSVAEYTRNAMGHRVQVVNGRVLFDGKRIDGSVVRDILKFMERGLPVQPLVNYLIRIRNNPSYRSIEALYEFRKANSLPITPDGHVLAYKAINADWWDKYTGKTYLNKIGAEIKCNRGDVVDDPDIACGPGLHVGGLGYVLGYASGVRLVSGTLARESEDSSRVVEVKIDPADAVSVPKDHGCGKMRVCRYKVISEVTKEYDPDLEVEIAEEPALRG